MSIEDLQRKLAATGSVVVPSTACPLDARDWEQLSILTDPAHCEYDRGGERKVHQLQVAALMIDVHTPQMTEHPAAHDALAIVASRRLVDFYRLLLNNDSVCVRRVQAHVMEAGARIGYHIDVTANPDYLAAAVFHLADPYEGGEFVVHENGATTTHKLEPYSMVFNVGAIPHEVAVVTSGRRRTVACFLSDQTRTNPVEVILDLAKTLSVRS